MTILGCNLRERIGFGIVFSLLNGDEKLRRCAKIVNFDRTWGKGMCIFKIFYIFEIQILGPENFWGFYVKLGLFIKVKLFGECESGG